MAKHLGDVEEVTGTAANIEDAAGRRVIEFEFADALQVDLHPGFQVEVFRWSVTGLFDCIFPADLLECCGIDGSDNGSSGEARRKSAVAQEGARVPFRAVKGFAGNYLGKFMRKTHWEALRNVMLPSCQSPSGDSENCNCLVK